MEAESTCSSSASEPQEDLTEEQRERIRRNRGRAHALREQRRKAKPYDGLIKRNVSSCTVASCTPDPSMPLSSRNSHAGFIIDDADDSSGPTHSYRRVEEEGKMLLYVL